jgi:hypothetical protein
LLALAVFAGVTTGSRAAGVSPSVDIELAFDTTGSMRQSLERARIDAQKILSGVRAVVPDARFAVVAFRDKDNPGGEYQVLQPLTDDSAAIKRGLGELKAVHNPAPGNLNVESYNLALHNSLSSTLGWRVNSRKIVVVMGDAEGYGGGTDGIPGCLDTHRDPDGLDMVAQLKRLQAAKRTLVMIREVSSATTVSLQCYASMAAMTYDGGAARDGDASDVATPLVGLVTGAVAPVSVLTSTPAVVPGTTASFRVVVSNPNTFPVQATSLSVTVPSDFTELTETPAATTTSGASLGWQIGQTLAPHAHLTFAVSARTGTTARVAQIAATANFQSDSGGTFSSNNGAILHVTRTIAIRANATARGGSIAGAATVRALAARSLASAAGTSVTGRFTITTRRGRVSLVPSSYRMSLDVGNATARLAVRVAASSVAGCARGAHGVLTATDRSFGSVSGRSTFRLALPGRCGSAAWSAGAGAVTPLP